MKSVIFIIFTSVVMAAASVSATESSDIIGTWNTEDYDAKIEIYKCGIKYCGKIVWLAQPTYPQDSKEGIPGTPVLDDYNPDPHLKKTPLLGLRILTDFEAAGNNTWDGGRIYDPDSGKSYGGKMHLLSANQLELRGFLGISLFGSTSIWTRQNSGN
jgi:uncharacterized protein (DUF2147 family)